MTAQGHDTDQLPSTSGEVGDPDRTRRGRVPGWSLVVVAIVLSLASVGLAVVWAVDRAADRLNPFAAPLIEERTIDRSGPAVLVALTDVGEYRAASGYYEVVVDVETEVSPLPSIIAGERVLLVAAGSVDASVDFTQLGEGAVVVNEDRTSASVTLPPPTLGEAALDLERSYVAGRDRGLLDRLGDALGGDAEEPGEGDAGLFLAAEERIAEAATETDELTERARENTRSFLESLLGSLGFTEVEVTFTDET